MRPECTVVTGNSTPRDLMRAAMRRLPTDRIPTMPQIEHHCALRIQAHRYGTDWLDGLKHCFEHPRAVYGCVIELVEELGCDGLRLFLGPEPVRIERVGDTLLAYDRTTGDRVGRMDTVGGGGIIPDVPAEPVQTLHEARERLERMVQDFSDERMEGLAEARGRVPHRFVASAPGGITMNTYIELRGREQALSDLHDRPGFVSDMMELQAEAMIKRAEKLLTTGIDALFIGDATASPSLIGPSHFERFCLPGYRKFCQHFENEEVLIYIHICGNSGPILEMLADTGVDVVEPLDPAGGVSVSDAKRRIGTRVALMGGLSTRTLAEGTAGEVASEAILKCRQGGPHGYVLAAGCMVPHETPIENLQAMVDVATKSLWRDHWETAGHEGH